MSVSSINLQDIDIMSDSMSLLGEDFCSVQDDGLVKYGELVLNIPPKASNFRSIHTLLGFQVEDTVLISQDGKALTLLADQLYSPSLLLAERIERGLIPLERRTVVELGAGCALPSILAATLPQGGPSVVIITDYPDEAIISNLRINVHANERLVPPSCFIACEGHEWGTDVTPLLNVLRSHNTQSTHGERGFDVVLLSDLLHYHNSHSAILSSLVQLLSRSLSACAYVSVETYTPPHVCNNFVRLAEGAGLMMEEGAPDDIWRGSREVWRMGKLNEDTLGIRKAMCRWWIVKWSKRALEDAYRSS